jgi:hypothetical protein
MSQFLRELEEREFKEQKKKTRVIPEEVMAEEETKSSNKEKKLAELHLEVLSLEDDFSLKKAEALIKNLKKYNAVLKAGLPSFLSKGFDKIVENKKCSSSLRAKINKVKEKYKEEETPLGEETTGKPEKVVCFSDHLNSALLSDDKEGSLATLMESRTDESEIAKIYFTLLGIRLKDLGPSRFDKLLDTLKGIGDLVGCGASLVYEGVDLRKNFIDNLGLYLDKLLSVMGDDKRDAYLDLLEYLNQVEGGIAETKYLEFKYFIEKVNVKTENKVFRLLYLVREDEYLACKEHYLENRVNYPVNILKEFGLRGFKCKDYLFCFKVLSDCYFSGESDLENTLSIVCVIIENEIKQEKFYSLFIEWLRCMEKNCMLLRSGNKKNEIFRAFYFLKKYDYSKCASILNGLEPGLECEDILRKSVIQSVCNKLK